MRLALALLLLAAGKRKDRNENVGMDRSDCGGIRFVGAAWGDGEVRQQSDGGAERGAGLSVFSDRGVRQTAERGINAAVVKRSCRSGRHGMGGLRWGNVYRAASSACAVALLLPVLSVAATWTAEYPTTGEIS